MKTTKGTGAENMILLFIHTIGNFTRNLTKDRDLLLGFFPHDVKTRVIYLSYSRKGKVVEALKQVISHRQIHLNTSLAIIKATIVYIDPPATFFCENLNLCNLSLTFHIHQTKLLPRVNDVIFQVRSVSRRKAILEDRHGCMHLRTRTVE